MFAHFDGVVSEKNADSIVLDVNGVGYLLFVSGATLSMAPAVGERMKLYSVLNVREDAMELFGFGDLTERRCFIQLTAVSGVGARVALNILSELTPDKLALAVSAGDHKALTRAKNVGPKLAQRLVLELKDKLGFGGVGDAVLPAAGGIPSAAGNADQAVNALTVLGFSASEASAAVAKLDAALPVNELVRQALKSLGRRG